MKKATIKLSVEISSTKKDKKTVLVDQPAYVLDFDSSLAVHRGASKDSWVITDIPTGLMVFYCIGTRAYTIHYFKEKIYQKYLDYKEKDKQQYYKKVDFKKSLEVI